FVTPSGGSAPPVAAAAEPSGPPPMPPFPHHAPNTGHWPRYLAEVLWWIVTAVWTVFVRLPKFFRTLIGIFLLITLFKMCNTTITTPPRRPEREREKPDA